MENESPPSSFSCREGIESIWALDLTILVSRLDAGHDDVQIAPLTVSCGPAASRRVARTAYAGRDNFIHFSKSYLLEPLGTRALHARRGGTAVAHMMEE